MSKRPIRLPRSAQSMLDVVSYGRLASGLSRFRPSQIAQIARTVRRTPEVMVKVTGGGRSGGAVAAHFAYISRRGELEIETDDGQRISGKEDTKALLEDWHLDLIAGQYRWHAKTAPDARRVKLVHSIVFSMPPPTPPEKVLAAAKHFAQEKFGLQHRYAMVLHTDQPNPHIHMVVKAESEHGHRLHIDKPMLRQWREDFAQAMREQGVEANATPRVVRGRNRGKTPDAIYRAQQRGESRALRERATSVVQELARTRTVRDPARDRLVNSRKALIVGWTKIAETLDAQGEISLAGDVRYFALTLPRVLTDRERLASKLVEHLKPTSPRQPNQTRGRDHTDELVR
jgi:hypothetical protein